MTDFANRPTSGPPEPSREATLARAAAEVRKARNEFSAQLRAVREQLKAAGLGFDAFAESSALFDGPAPANLGPGSVVAGAAVFASPIELLRSLGILPGLSVCAIGSSHGSVISHLLERCPPN